MSLTEKPELPADRRPRRRRARHPGAVVPGRRRRRPAQPGPRPGLRRRRRRAGRRGGHLERRGAAHPGDRGRRHLRRRRRRRRLLGRRARPARRRPGHRARPGAQRGRLADDHHPPDAGPDASTPSAASPASRPASSGSAVLEAAAEFGLAGLCGSSSDVGVVGYTLGGGMGSLGRKYGFAADHVQAVEIVTADGRLRRVCADSEPELFWAVRGGKGNFGIVTALEIELVPVALAVRRRHLLRRRRRPRPAAPLPPVGARRCRRRSAPRSRSCGCRRHGGAAAAAARADRRPPAVRLLRRRPRRGRAAALADEGRRARSCSASSARCGPTRWTASTWTRSTRCRRWEKGMLLADLTEETVDALLAAAGPQVEIPLIMAEIRLMGGALGRPAEGAQRGRRAGTAPTRCWSSARGSRSWRRSCRRSARACSARSRRGRRPACMINFLGDVSGPEEVLGGLPAGDAASGCARSSAPSTRPASSPSATPSDCLRRLDAQVACAVQPPLTRAAGRRGCRCPAGPAAA